MYLYPYGTFETESDLKLRWKYLFLGWTWRRQWFWYEWFWIYCWQWGQQYNSQPQETYILDSNQCHVLKRSIFNFLEVYIYILKNYLLHPSRDFFFGGGDKKGTLIRKFSPWLSHFIQKCFLQVTNKSLLFKSGKKSSSLEYYWRPPGRLVGDPQILIGDPHIFIGDPRFSLETPIFSLETPTFLLETPIFLLETPIFS